jgi:hypothetical protein
MHKLHKRIASGLSDWAVMTWDTMQPFAVFGADARIEIWQWESAPCPKLADNELEVRGWLLRKR